MTTELDQDLEPLTAEDRLLIAEAIGGVMLCIDMGDWDRGLRYLSAVVTTDYTSVFGGDPVTCSREEVIDGWRSRLPGFDATQHTVTQTLVTGAGAAASAVSNLRAAHWIDGQIWAFGGIYHHDVLKSPRGWQIASIRIAMTYEEGERSVRADAMRRMADRLGSTVEELSVIGRSASQIGT